MIALSPPCTGIPVLLIGDDRDFREGLTALLRDDGHDVREFELPSQVPRDERLNQVGIVITDCLAPSLDGVAFADEFHAIHPDVPVIFLTAYGAETIEARVGARAFVHLAPRPVNYDDLHGRIHDLTG